MTATQTAQPGTPMRILDERHRAELRTSGLTDETIAASGIFSAADGVIRDHLKWQPKDRQWGRALVIPFRSADGAELFGHRIKLDRPRQDADGKPIKYESPRNKANRAYFPPGFNEVLAKTGVIVFVEGEKKALALVQAGVAAVGIVGVFGWQQRRPRTNGKAYGPRELIPDLTGLDLDGRHVAICFDSDVKTNPSVQIAEHYFAEALSARGAKVKAIRIPRPGEDKVGIDDYLVEKGGDSAVEFQALLDAAQKPEAPDKPGPMDWAKRFIEECFSTALGTTIIWHAEVFYRWTGTHYVELPESELAAVALKWIDKKQKGAAPRLGTEIAKCIGALHLIPNTRRAPCFIDSPVDHEPVTNIIPFRNGLLDISNLGGDLTLTAHSPNWFATACLPFDFDPKAQCPLWESFLDQVFDGDAQRIDLLQKFMGLLLTPDTSFQKILMMLGPKRSGKGTILKVIEHIVGPQNCVSPSLNSLASPFGLWPLLNRTVCMFPDASLSGRADSTRILELLKSVSGEDSQSVNRKNLSFVDARLLVRFVITVNELPRFNDNAAVLESRLLLLPFTQSFAGREDLQLEGKLKLEESGILNFALGGLCNLRAEGKFTEPEASRAIMTSYRLIMSPATQFLEDWTDARPDEWTKCDDLYAAWQAWCVKNGRAPGASSTFGEHLRVADVSIERKRRSDNDPNAIVKRPWAYVGRVMNEAGREAVRNFDRSGTRGGAYGAE